MRADAHAAQMYTQAQLASFSGQSYQTTSTAYQSLDLQRAAPALASFQRSAPMYKPGEYSSTRSTWSPTNNLYVRTATLSVSDVRVTLWAASNSRARPLCVFHVHAVPLPF